VREIHKYASVLWSKLILFVGSGDYTPIDMLQKINNMSTAIMCVNISTIYDDNPMNMNETFVVSLSSNDPKVYIPKESANTTVTIENSKNCFVIQYLDHLFW
jgi:hypothetical protein